MSNPKKRAAPDQDGEGGKKKKKKSAFAVDETLLNGELGINESFAVMDNQLLADYTAQKLTRFGTDLSSVELSDLSISGELLIHLILPAALNHENRPKRCYYSTWPIL